MMKSISIGELKNKKQWVCWAYKNIDGRATKVPKNPNNGQNARVNDSSPWGTYSQCLTAKAQYGFDGIGIVFADGVCGIDIDAINHHSDTAENNPLSDKIHEMFSDTYMETSPSKKGVHILGLCDIGALRFVNNIDGGLKIDSQYYSKNPHNQLEIYFSGVTNRFFTFTEESINTDNLIDITDRIKEFMNQYMRKNEMTRKDTKTMDNQEILYRARTSKNASKFMKLYDLGDISDYNYDDSSADLALCRMLAFWCNNDRDMVDELFCSSKLYRDKWDRKDYREMTLRKDCDGDALTKTSQSTKMSELTLIDLEDWLSQNNIIVKSNEITHEVEVTGFSDVYNPQINLPLSISIGFLPL